MQQRLYSNVTIEDLAKEMRCSPFQIVEQFVIGKTKQFYRGNRAKEKESSFTCPFCGSTHTRKNGVLNSFKNYRGYELHQVGGRYLQATHSYEVFNAYLCSDCSEKRYYAIRNAKIIAWIATIALAIIVYFLISSSFHWDSEVMPLMATAVIFGLLGYIPFKLIKNICLNGSKFAGAKSHLNLKDVGDALPWEYFDLAPMIVMSKCDNLSSLYNSTEAKKILKSFGIENTTLVGESIVLDPRLFKEQKEYLLNKLAKGLTQQDVNEFVSNGSRFMF